MHLLNYGYALSMADLSDHTGSIEQIISYMLEYKYSISDEREGWLLGRGWNQDYFSGEKRFPDKHDLDKISKTRPVCITRACGHCCVVNSKALKLMGFTEDSSSKIDKNGVGMEKNGTFNGIFQENAMNYVFEAMPKPDVSAIKAMPLKAMTALNSYGVTSCQTDDLVCFDIPYTQVLSAYKELESEGRMTVRVNEQSQFSGINQLEAIKRMKLHIYVQTIFLDYDIRIVGSRAGDLLALSSYAFHSLKTGGCHVSNGSDCPVECPDVMAGIQCGVTRKSLDGQEGPYIPDEAMSVYEALDSYTKEGAYASFEENVKGTISPGKFADFVILSENPADTAENEIKNISVMSAYLGGRCVYINSKK